MHAYANMALRAARKASQHILRSMDRLESLKIEEKRQNDFVSNVDREAEALIVETLTTAYPDHGIQGEEGSAINPDSAYQWIIDPLDGTLNYLQGIPHFGISIALLHKHRIEHGVVVDPLRNEEFVASHGAGTQLNGKRVRVSTTRTLNDAVLATGIPPHAVKDRVDSFLGMFGDFTRQCRSMRRMGSAALDLAYVAAGRVDGFWEFALKPWDIAAGVLLVREAGGFVGDLAGGESFLSTGDIVAANPKCFKAMVQITREHLHT